MEKIKKCNWENCSKTIRHFNKSGLCIYHQQRRSNKIRLDRLKNKGICISCGKIEGEKILCPHCNEVIKKRIRCKECYQKQLDYAKKNKLEKELNI